LWDIQTQRILYQVNSLDASFLQDLFAFSPDGLDMFFIDLNGSIWKSENFSSALLVAGYNYYPYIVTDVDLYQHYHFNQAGHFVLFDLDKKYPKITDTVTQQSKTIPFELFNDQHRSDVEAYSLTPDDTLVAFGTTENIHVWNMETLQQVSVLTGHEVQTGDGFYGMIRSVLFSPQSDLLVSVGWGDRTTRLWNVRGGQELRRLNVCCQASFTPDGRYLVTAGDGVLRVWGIPTPVP
jgi:WD40 repeat protein